ncbi:TPA: hypothetical protein ACX6Q6_003556 [Photobacterium damselae]
MINVQQLNSGRIQSTMRETDKGYYYAKRIDTSRDQDEVNFFNRMMGQGSSLVGKVAQKQQEDDYNKAIVDSAQMDDKNLGIAMKNDANSDSYRRGLRAISMHRSYLNIKEQIAAKSQDLIDQNLPANQIQNQLTAYGTQLMNKDPNLKNFDPNEVATKFYMPLLTDIGNQVVSYSEQSAKNMKDKAYQELGSVTESAITGDMQNRALTSQQTQDNMVTHMDNLITQAHIADFSPDEVNSKVMQTALAVALKTNDVRVLHALDKTMLHGKAVSSYPENALRISEAVSQINNHKKMLHAQAMADHDKAMSNYYDSLSARGYREMLHNPNGDQSAIQNQLANSGDWKAIAAYNRGANAARSMKNNEHNDANQQLQLSMMKHIMYDTNKYSNEQIYDIGLQHRMTPSQVNSLVEANSPKGLRDVVNGNPSINLGLQRLKGYITMPKNGESFNTAKNNQVQTEIGNVGVYLQSLAAKDGGQLSPESVKAADKEINEAIRRVNSSTPLEAEQAADGSNSMATVTKQQVSFGNAGNDKLVDGFLSKPDVNIDRLAEAIAGRQGDTSPQHIAEIKEKLNERRQQLSS